MRTLLFSVALFLATVQAAGAQDAFYGTDYADAFAGAGAEPIVIAGIRHTGTNTYVSNAELLNPQKIRKLAQYQAGMDAALKAGNTLEYALNAYRIHTMLKDETYKILGDLATGETTIDEITIGDGPDQHDAIKALLLAQGKEADYLKYVERLAAEQPDGEKDLAEARVANAGKSPAVSGLRHLRNSMMRVYIRGWGIARRPHAAPLR